MKSSKCDRSIDFTDLKEISKQLGLTYKFMGTFNGSIEDINKSTENHEIGAVVGDVRVIKYKSITTVDGEEITIDKTDTVVYTGSVWEVIEVIEYVEIWTILVSNDNINFETYGSYFIMSKAIEEFEKAVLKYNYVHLEYSKEMKQDEEKEESH